MTQVGGIRAAWSGCRPLLISDATQERTMPSSATYEVPSEPLSPLGLHITRQIIGRRAVLSVSGEIDLDTAPFLARAVDTALAAGASELWIDLSTTGFMDSAGVHLLLATQERVRELNRRLAIICSGRPVRRVFEVAGAADRLPLYADRDAAHRAA
jgi:anti-sigma B factor antagonist